MLLLVTTQQPLETYLYIKVLKRQKPSNSSTPIYRGCSLKKEKDYAETTLCSTVQPSQGHSN